MQRCSRKNQMENNDVIIPKSSSIGAQEMSQCREERIDKKSGITKVGSRGFVW